MSNVKRFRTRTVEVNAIRFVEDTFDEVREWTFDHDGNTARFRRRDRAFAPDFNDFPVEVYDDLHQSWISVAEGQWIVRGAKGEFYPCDDETFHWKYEEITSS